MEHPIQQFHPLFVLFHYKNQNGDVEPAENGFYKPEDGSIHIDLNAENGHILFTIAHELVHSIKDDSPKHFKQLADIVMDGFSKKNADLDQLIADRQEEAREHKRKLSEEDAYEEVIAHALEGILADGKVMELMRMIEGKNKSLGTKIREFFQDIIQLIKDTIDAYRGVLPESVEGRAIMRMEDIRESLQAVFAEGLYESGENFRKTEKNTATDGGVRYSFGVTQGDIDTYVHAAYENENSRDYIKYAKVSPRLVGDVSAEIDINGYSHALRDNDIRHIRNSHGERTNEKYPVTEADLAKIPDIVANYDKVFVKTNAQGKPGLVYVKVGENNVTYYVEAVTEEYHNEKLLVNKQMIKTGLDEIPNLRGLIAAINKKESSSQYLADLQKIREAYVQDVKENYSINSISNPSADVKQNDSAESDSVKNALRRKVQPTVADMLRKENAELRNDVARLKDLLKLQRTVTNGTVFRQTDVGHAANMLKKNNNASGNTQELSDLLNDFYKYIAEGKELSWDGVREKAMPAVNWLQDHVKQERSEYAQDVLNSIRGNRVYLDETQKAEAAYRFGSLNDFRKLMMGNIVIANDANMSLDSLWHELSGMYPDVFDPDMNAADMPEALADIVDRLRNEDTSFMEYEYNRDMIQQDLIRQVYDSYWRVSTVKTYADMMQAKINRIKSQHYQKISELRAEYGEKIDRIKAEHRAEVQSLRKTFHERMERQQKQITQHYQESRKRDVERRNRTKMRNKIRTVVSELNQLLKKDEKVRHVPDNLKNAVVEALDLVDTDAIGVPERIEKLTAQMKQLEKEMATAKERGDERRQVIIQREINDTQALLDKYTKMGDRIQRMHQAYEEIKNSSDPDIANAYDPVISRCLEELSETIKDTPFKDMSMEQLEDVYSMYTMVLTRVRDANKAFAEGRAEGIRDLATKVMDEVQKIGGAKSFRLSGMELGRQYAWNNLKPVYAMERIGSQTLGDVFKNVRAGEDTWAVDVSNANAFYRDKAKKYGYDTWDLGKRYQFENSSGKKFDLSLQQILSLYAYSKRSQAHDHLRLGGFVFDSNIEVAYYDKKGKELSKHDPRRLINRFVKYKVNTADAHQLTPEMLGEIIEVLSPEQKAFADEMQQYLSAVMGAKGNEVTMRMYGVKLFKEKFYFPLKSAKQFLFEQNEVAGEVRIKNSGFTNKVVAKANNPVILRDFIDVWADHVNDMSMYHAFVLPLEDFNRVFNYNSPKTEGVEPRSVKGTIQNAYAPAAVEYVKQLITDLNGGAIADPRESFAKKWTARFKKAKVFTSLSVVIQQPSAIGRAFAVVPFKYFQPTRDGMTHKQLWSELKQYAPVAIIKEMGYFDTNMGRSAREYILSNEYQGLAEKAKAVVTDSTYRDEVLSRLPAWADEVTWCAIWNAVKRETAATHKDLQPGSEEFLKTAGERFTEVITKTQVYDSVLARSANMRSKSGLMGMLTSFLAEPTTTINMLEDAIIKAKRGDGKYARRAVASVMVSVVLNNALVALIYGLRDDDEDKTYLEKYLDSFASGMIDDINPLTYYPFIKDLWSLFQGYDVERADVSLFGDFADAAKALFKAYSSEDGDVGSAWWDLTGTVANIFGIPVENISREIEGIVNTFSQAFGNRKKTTWSSVVDALQESARSSLPILGWIDGESKADKLYDAVISGDTAYVERMKDSYKDEKAYLTALREAIKGRFEEGELDEDTAVEHLVEYCGMDQNDAMADVQYWIFKQEYPNVNVDDAWFDTYQEKVAHSGIPVEVYMEYRNTVSTITGDGKKKKRMDVIHSLPLTTAQKDALYLAEGWSKNTIHEAPWH